MMMRGILMTLALVAGCFLPQISLAQNQSCTVTGASPLGSCSLTRGPYTANIQRTVEIIVTPTAMNLGSPTASDYLNGFQHITGHAAEIHSNYPWQLSIRSTQSSFSGSGGARTNKPRSDLSWSLTSGSGYTVITGNNAAANVVVTTGTATGSEVVQLFYRVAWSWSLDTPGTYSLPLVLTIAAP